jgi:hypothetical protein
MSLSGGYPTPASNLSIPGVAYDTKTFGPYTAKETTTVEIPFSYELPKKVGGVGLGISVTIRLKGGLPLSYSSVFLKEVSGGTKLLGVKEISIDVDGKKYEPTPGPIIEKNSVANIRLTVSNSGKVAESVKPVLEIRKDTSAGKLVAKKEGVYASVSV